MLLGFLVLPVRGVLYTLSGNPYCLVSVQILDGMGAGIFGVLSVLVVADLTRGTGRFNLTNGAISTAIGIGAALSNAISGVLVHYAGYRGAFLTLAAIAGLAGLWFGLMMPETQGNSTEDTNPVYDMTVDPQHAAAMLTAMTVYRHLSTVLDTNPRCLAARGVLPSPPYSRYTLIKIVYPKGHGAMPGVERALLSDDTGVHRWDTLHGKAYSRHCK